MGKTYIKEENGQKVLYEENSFFADTKLGELHENLDGSLETRNFFGENHKLTEDKSELGEILTCIIPGTVPNDYKVETSGGESGTLKWNSWKERHELEDKLTRHSSERQYLEDKVTEHSSGSRSYSGGASYGNVRTKSKDAGSALAAILKFSLVCGLLNGLYWGYRDYKEHPEKYNLTSYQAPIILYPRAQQHGRGNKYTVSNSRYKVRSGDTLWEIARTFDVSVMSLQEANGLGRRSRIFVGQELKIPSGVLSSVDKRDFNRSKAQKLSTDSTGVDKNIIYKVQRGDTFRDIARRFGTTPDYLLKINGLRRGRQLYIGQELHITGRKKGSWSLHSDSIAIDNKYPSADGNASLDNTLNLIPEDECSDLERFALQKEVLEIVESEFIARHISESQKNWYVNFVKSESTSTTSLDNLKRRMSQPVNIRDTIY